MTGSLPARLGRIAAILMIASVIVLPLQQLAGATAAALPDTTTSATVATGTTAAATTTATVLPSIALDTTFVPLPRGGRSPWDGEFRLDGIDGLSYNTPGTEVKVRAMSSNAAFVDEVWLVYPRVQYLFNNKDIPDLGNAFDQISFSSWVSVGTFPPGTELIFGVKTGVGIGQGTDQCTLAGNHCYKTTQDPTFVPLAPDPLRNCADTDTSCWSKAWPTLTLDGRSIFYTGPGLRNRADRSPHGRFQLLNCSVRPVNGTCPAGSELTDTALFGLEDVGAPVQANGAPCPGARALEALVTTTPITNLHPELTGAQRTAVAIGQTQTIGLSSVAGLTVNSQIDVTQPFQNETVTISAIDTVAKTITALFLDPDDKPYAAGVHWAPAGCLWHPDFQDAGVVVWPALAATCQATAVLDRVAIVGQQGYGSVTLRDATQTTAFTQAFLPGDLITFTADGTAPIAVSGASPSWAINVHGQALLRITDPSAPDQVTLVDSSGNPVLLDGQPVLVANANKTLDAGICFDPTFPPLPLIPATIGAKTCAGSWDFTIDSVTAATAPVSIRVSLTNDQTPPADEAITIPLTSVTNGVAHYQSDQFTTLRAVSAMASKPTATWSGTFSLTAGPCPADKPADLTLACATGLSGWDLTITQTTQVQAPGKVHVTWKDGSSADVPLTGAVTNGIAHYQTTAHLDQQMTSATASIQGTWNGTFSVNGVACPGAKHITLTTIPACTQGATQWDLTISGLTAAPGAGSSTPVSISVTWNGQAETVAFSSLASGVAHYTTTAHTGATYAVPTAVAADLTFATVADADAFTGQLGTAANGVPCAPPTTKNVDATLTACAAYATAWDITMDGVTTATAPAQIALTWSGGLVGSATLAGVTNGVAHYTTAANAGVALVGATATVPASWSGTFTLASGPAGPCPPRPPLCAAPAAIASDFNGTGIAKGRVVWFASSVKVQDPKKQAVAIQLNGAKVTFSANGTTYELPAPKAKVTFDPSATASTTTFDGATNTWTTISAASEDGEAFLTGFAFTVPATFTGAIKPVVWTGTFGTDTAGVSLQWRWSATIYSSLSTDYRTLGVKPVDDKKTSTYKNSDKAGTLESFKAFFLGSARNETGQSPVKPVCPPPPTPTSCPAVEPGKTPRPTPTAKPSQTPKPASGTGSGSRSKAGTNAGASSKAGTGAGTKGATANGSATGTHSGSKGGTKLSTKDGTSGTATVRALTNSGANAGTKAGTNAGTKGGTKNGSGTGTHSASKAGTKAGTKDGTCETPKPTPSTPPPSASTPPPAASTPPPAASTPPPSTGIVHVKAATLTDHSCDPSQWHFVITQSSLFAPSSITVKFANGQTVVVTLGTVTGGTSSYRTTQDLDSPVVDATAVLPSTWVGQFNISSGPCFTTQSQNTTVAATTPPPASPSASPSSPPTMQIVSNTSGPGGTRTITLRVRIPGTEDYKTVTVTLPGR